MYKKIKVELDKNYFKNSNNPFRVFLIYRIYGQKNDFYVESNYFHRSNPEFLYKLEKDTIDIQNSAFLKINNKEKKIIIKEGNWIISKPLIIPPKYQLIANNKTTLSLEDKDNIIIRKCKFTGSSNDPIKIINKNKSMEMDLELLINNKSH